MGEDFFDVVGGFEEFYDLLGGLDLFFSVCFPGFFGLLSNGCLAMSTFLSSTLLLNQV